ncbi:DNA ligase 4 [Microplitis demolitor]|uniref:DNA ligase 4 n=1 Tax=Microplitis demolitor TaxID=69319 RepID=UPI00235B61DF|nr:DNA ligase 4 [Microplitis demolitor]
MTTLASKIEFNEFCNLLEEILKAQSKNKIKILTDFLNKYREIGKKLKDENPDADISLFPIMRLLLINKDHERGPYGLKEKSLGNLYVRIFCLGNSDDAKKIINYRIPTEQKAQTNDFAEKVYWILKRRLRNACNLSIEQINFVLDKIAENNRQNKSKDSEFIYLVQQCGALEVKWLTRIILKSIRIGLGEKQILNAYHEDAESLFGEQSNLREVCDVLHNLKYRIKKSSNISVLSPFKPMLLERLTLDRLSELFVHCPEYVVQTKFDGERSQLHMINNKYKYYTRHGYDVTNHSSYGESPASGHLTSKISALLSPSCSSIILDGELMGWHKEKSCFGSKAMSFDVKKLTFKSVFQPCLMVFDIILYNDQLVVNLPLKERLKIIETAFTPKDGVLMRSKNTFVTRVEEILEIFNHSLDNADEGIVIKDSSGVYKPNSREGNKCYKLKAEYSSNLVEDIDLLIVGGYYGQGKHSGMYSSFLVALVVPGVDEASQIFKSVVSVSTGITGDKLKELNNRFADHWTSERPANVVGPKKDPPDSWLPPEKSLVLQIRATELIRCDTQPTGYTLRFPRVKLIRDDKPWYDACTITEFKSLIKNWGSVNKLTKRHANEEDLKSLGSSKRRETESKFIKPVRMDEKHFGVRAADVERQTRLMEGKEFCVINGELDNHADDVVLTKENIEIILLQHSAKVVQNPGKNTFCVIVGNSETMKAVNLINSGKYDIVKTCWLKRATVEENWGNLVDWFPWEMLAMRKETKERLGKDYDIYWDSYYMDADDESLKRSLDRVDKFAEEKVFEKEDYEDLDKEFCNLEVRLFERVVGHFVDDDWLKSPFLFMKGTISENVDEFTTHVFVGDVFDRINIYKKINDSGKTFIKLLNRMWVKDCFDRGCLLPEIDYIVQ